MGGVKKGDDVAPFALFSFQSFPKPGCQASFPRPPIRDSVQIIGTSQLEQTHVYVWETIHPHLPIKTEFAFVNYFLEQSLKTSFELIFRAEVK